MRGLHTGAVCSTLDEALYIRLDLALFQNSMLTSLCFCEDIVGDGHMHLLKCMAIRVRVLNWTSALFYLLVYASLNCTMTVVEEVHQLEGSIDEKYYLNFYTS